tara:strand:+ start:7128 stop:8000 length:873 start_codon:yes stop_codon:yes gene_type:complete
MMISREDFIQELRLRQGVREILKKLMSARDITEVKEDFVLSEDRKLRKHVRKMILKEKTDFAPHGNTGINVLTDLLERILPVVERDYKSLTTSMEQRDSYRSHFVLAVQNAIGSLRVVEDPADASAMAKAGSEEEEKPTGMSADELEEAESEFDKFIDITAPRSSTATDVDGDGSIDMQSADADLTGRNFAAKTFDKIEQNIADSFSILANPKDEDMFTDYLLTNLKLYFDKYEDELKGVVAEPSTAEYEDEKAEMDADAAADDLGGEEELGSPDELGGEEEDDDIDITL